MKQKDGSFGHICGGSIIDPTTIVSAAHCVATHDASELQVGQIQSWRIWKDSGS